MTRSTEQAQTHQSREGRGILADTRTLAALLVLLVMSVSLFSIEQRRQLGTIAGFTAPDIALGFNLAARDVIGVGDEPTIWKAPGHAVFVAAVTRLAVGRPSFDAVARANIPPAWVGLVPPYEPDQLRRAAKAVYVAQAVLLAAATGALFLWLSTFAPRSIALSLSGSFGLSPYSIVLVGLLHYAMLHTATLVLAAWLLHRALVAAPERATWKMAAAGIAWGLTTAVRSITLPMPAIVALTLAVSHRPWRRVAHLSTVFALAFCLGVAPASWRASRLAGRFVAVNAQLWSALWNTTVREAPAMPNHFRWKVFREDYLKLQSATAGRTLTAAGDPYRVSDNLTMEDIARNGTLDHIRQDSGPYVSNALSSFRSFNWDVNAVFLQLFQHRQRGLPAVPPWFWPGTPQRFYDPALRNAFTWFVRCLTLVALAGLLVSLPARDKAMLSASLAYGCLCAVHSLTLLDVLFYYAKLPFLYVGAAYALARLSRVPALRPIASVLAWLTLLATLAMTRWLLAA